MAGADYLETDGEVVVAETGADAGGGMAGEVEGVGEGDDVQGFFRSWPAMRGPGAGVDGLDRSVGVRRGRTSREEVPQRLHEFRAVAHRLPELLPR